MIVAGVDYSMTSPALCIFDDTWGEFNFENCIVYYLTKTKKYDTFFRNVQGDYFEYSDSMDRYDIISSYFLDKIKTCQIGTVYIEGYSMGSKGMIFDIAENTGIFKYRMWEQTIFSKVVAPSAIKKFATGKGNANKELMQDVFIAENGIDLKFHLGMTEKQWNPSSDIIDAYYICKYGYYKEKEIDRNEF